MFNLINSNDLDILSELCAEIIKHNDDNEDLMTRCLRFERIIVMNKGIQTYMRQHIASSKTGIAAGIEFLQLWTFIWEIHKSIHKADNVNRFAHDYISHTIFSLKEIWLKSEGFERMQQYAADDDESNIKTYELCLKLADTFDQYQMYRPDWLDTWETFKDSDFSIYYENPNFEGVIHSWILKTSRKNKSLYTLLEDNLWQARLWNLVCKTIKDKYDKKSGQNPYDYMTRSEVIKALCNHRYTKADIDLLPKRIFIVGISALPPHIYELFNVLSKHMDIFYMLLNPCQEYWGDLCYKHNDIFTKDEAEFLFNRSTAENKDLAFLDQGNNKNTTLKASEFEKVEGDNLFNENDFSEYERVEGNQLLLALGREGKENLAVMYDRIENINNTDAFIENDETSLLNSIKNQLLTLTSPEKRQLINKDDISLEIHSCHTITREVEVLRDAILTKFKQAQDKGEDLQPRDILVMVPEIEEYAPYIEAAFGGVDKNDKSYIPYAISDRATNQESVLADAILKLLACGKTPVTAGFIIDLLNVGAVANKFDLNTQEVSLITTWCVKTAIHRGLDNQDLIENENVKKSEFLDLPWTFEHGICRMLDGYASGNNTQSGAYTDIEGTDSQVLGKFAEFITRLKNLKQNFPKELSFFDEEDSRSLQRWFYEEILNQFFDVNDPKDERDLSKIKNIIGKIKTVTSEFKEQNSHQNKISLLVFRRMLEKALSNQHDSIGYLREKLNFCSLIPMRAVPFKHIFIMGLNDTSFPRHSSMPGFNLLSNAALRRRGDRSQAIDDRYIFLESILSAKDSLYLSYLGQNPIDQTESYPSSVISELLDYIADHFTTKEDLNINDAEYRSQIQKRLIKEEHLNAYDIKNFLKNDEPPALPSFDDSCFIENPTNTKKPPIFLAKGNDFNIKLPQNIEVNIDDLIAFVKSPSRFFLKNSLNLEIKSYEQELPEDDESFSLNRLECGAIISDVINNAENTDNPDNNIDEKLEQASKSGFMPYGVFLENARSLLKSTASFMLNALNEESIKISSARKIVKMPPLTVSVLGKNYTVNVSGEIPVMNAVINPYTTEESPKRLLEALIIGLFGPYAGFHNKYVYVINTKQISKMFIKDDANDRLEAIKDLLSLYIKGLIRPQCCGDKTLKKLKKSIKDTEIDESILSQVLEFESFSDEQRYLFGSPKEALSDKAFADDLLDFLKFFDSYVIRALDK